MPYFFCRLNPPRPSFALDMTDEEQQLMGEHGIYWTSRLEAGEVVLFGVVGDPVGPWGALVVRAQDDEAARTMTLGDPVIERGDGFNYDVFPMPNAVVAGAASPAA